MLDALGNLGDFLGGLGVIVTLAYLALQIRQNTQALRRGAYQDLLNHMATLNAKILDREYAEVVVAVRDDGLDALDAVDQQRFSNHTMSIFRHYENAYQQYSAGVLSQAQWHQLSWPIAALINSKGRFEAWSAMEFQFSDEFRSWVRAQVKETESENAA